MARQPKKLFQTTSTSSVAVIYTAPSSTTPQITEMWICNTNTSSTVTFSVYVHGTASTNLLLNENTLITRETKIVDGSKLILATGETVAFKQDSGADIVITGYGIEEA